MSEEQKEIAPINFIEIGKKLWKHRKKYYIVLPTTLIITYLIILCVPRYYRCIVSMAPETDGASLSGSVESLASSFGLDGALGKLNSNDAIYAEIYPVVIASKDFIAELMTVEVKTQEGDVHCNYYTYIREHQKIPWWSILINAIKSSIVESKPDTYDGKEKLSVFNHTKEQENVFDAIQNKITCRYNKQTDIFSIIVKDQDPLVCATMANATCKKLQEFIVNYRTNKAHIDYEYYKKLTAEAKAAYVEARQQYVSYADANQDIMLESYKAKEEDLENEMQLKYNVYTAMNTQMQGAAARLQQATPAFTVIESASIPHKPAGPKRMIISILMTILAGIVLSVIILMKKEAAE